MRLIERRIGLLFAAFFLCFSIVVARALWLQGVRGGALASQASYQQSDTVTVPGLRGTVYDRSGDELAVSEDAASIYATPYQVKDPERTASRLAPLLDVSKDDLLKALTAQNGFSYLAHKVDIPTANKIKAMKIVGIGTLPDSRRVYPQGSIAAQVLGAVSSTGEGLSGLEAGEQSVLGGTDGQERVINDALGEPIRLDTLRAARDGHDIRTTLDSYLQTRTEGVLAQVGSAYQAKRATAIIMDPRSSKVLAMANWPPVNLDDLSDAGRNDLINQGTGFTYEPGSTFKAITVAAALENHTVTPNTSFYLPSKLQVADRTIEDAEARPPITATVAQILAQSSNIGAVKIALALGAKKFSHWVDRFGFGRTTGIQYPAEEGGIVPSYEDYSGSSIGNLPIGQGISVTPIQMMQAYAAIANGGILRRPQLVTEVDGKPVREAPGHRVIKPWVAAELRQMLEGVLAAGGTAEEVSVDGYTLAGKTGTAQVAENGGYSKTKFVASFMGFAPASNPQLLVSVIVDQPQGEEYSGGAVAAPAFGQIASFALPYLGIAPG
jgi:cell division protein FtsI (penicillin-binding protein 3)